MIRNPILRGFNPDPSICRVDDDFFIATSTFEWYPGVQIHHSRDLANWRLAARPLNHERLLNLIGVPDSCGIWAPCLSWHEGLFWLCYTVVRRFDGNFKDTHNYLTSCPTVDGDWSDPIYLNSSGFDPSLFHAEDGRKWYLNMVWDHRPDRGFFHGIALQEYSVEQARLIGERKIIFAGTDLDGTEGPHLYHYDDHYYLMTAEGGTGYGHAVTMARSRAIDGPYEADPSGPVVTSAHASDHPLQRAGHGDLLETSDGRLFLIHLCSRPLSGTRRSPMGRESAIQAIERNEAGWFRLAGGGQLPQVDVDVGAEAGPANTDAADQRHDFQPGSLPSFFQWLRSPWPERLFSLSDRPGYLRLYGMESLGSHHEQALVARRQEDFYFQAETAVLFEPEHFQQMAGLVCYYNSSKFHYLYLSRDEEVGKHLAIMSCPADPSLAAEFPDYGHRVPVPEGELIHLRVRVSGRRLLFSWSVDGSVWSDIAHTLDASLLSDETGKGEGAQFTGNFIGMCCQDLAGTRRPADFAYFSYRSPHTD